MVEFVIFFMGYLTALLAVKIRDYLHSTKLTQETTAHKPSAEGAQDFNSRLK